MQIHQPILPSSNQQRTMQWRSIVRFEHQNKTQTKQDHARIEIAFCNFASFQVSTISWISITYRPIIISNTEMQSFSQNNIKSSPTTDPCMPEKIWIDITQSWELSTISLRLRPNHTRADSLTQHQIHRYSNKRHQTQAETTVNAEAQKRKRNRTRKQQTECKS